MNDEQRIEDLAPADKETAEISRMLQDADAPGACRCSHPDPDGDACRICGLLVPGEPTCDPDEDEIGRRGGEVGEAWDPGKPCFKPPSQLSAHTRIRMHELLGEALHEYAQVAIAMDRDLARGNPRSLRITMVKSAMRSARETTASLVASKFHDLLVESGLFAADEESPAEEASSADCHAPREQGSS